MGMVCRNLDRFAQDFTGNGLYPPAVSDLVYRGADVWVTCSLLALPYQHQ